MLRFTTAVSVAVQRGARVLPHPGDDDEAATYAAQHNALLASRGRGEGWSLSPTDLGRIPAGVRLVLPSPNGSALAFAARRHARGAVFAGCLRNASAVASAAWSNGGPIVVIAAGERSHDEGAPLRSGLEAEPLGEAVARAARRRRRQEREATQTRAQNGETALRLAVEDLLGAGAVLRAIRVRAGVPLERISPEARAAMAAFDDARDDLQEWLFASASGRELAAWGWRDDVETAAALDVDGAAPVLTGPAFVAAGRPRGHLVRQ